MVPQTAPGAMELANVPSAWTRMLPQGLGGVSARARSRLQLKTAKSPALGRMMEWALRRCPPTLSRGRYHLLCSRPVGATAAPCEL